jgi:hypothetical protein
MLIDDNDDNDDNDIDYNDVDENHPFFHRF